MPEKKPKLLVILGPTSSGKSDLAVELALTFNGEVISADSRQVYKDLDIGTGKIIKSEMKGIPHHLLDVVSPKSRQPFTVQKFANKAHAAIADIHARGKLPILCGGTGFYIDVVTKGIVLPDVGADTKLRTELKKKETKELLTILSELDPDRAASVDWRNPYRVIRAIEIAKSLGSVPAIEENSVYDVLKIGIATDDTELKERINARLLKRLENGMLDEAKRLREAGLTNQRMFDLGLEYRYMSLHLQGKISHDEMVEKLSVKIWQYAKRQKAWFKRDQDIQWFTLKGKSEIEKDVKEFMGLK